MNCRIPALVWGDCPTTKRSNTSFKAALATASTRQEKHDERLCLGRVSVHPPQIKGNCIFLREIKAKTFVLFPNLGVCSTEPIFWFKGKPTENQLLWGEPIFSGTHDSMIIPQLGAWSSSARAGTCGSPPRRLPGGSWDAPPRPWRRSTRSGTRPGPPGMAGAPQAGLPDRRAKTCTAPGAKTMSRKPFSEHVPQTAHVFLNTVCPSSGQLSGVAFSTR